jgi:alkanesulfonate monooxygenase SsuD/methylene tetrahydromethanopterin reductase-like flavin-dependent oxidoreductase (luciferase family)
LNREVRIILGPLIVPLARRRPWRVALEAATLRQVAEGRLILGVGMGVPRDYARFGEPDNWRERAERLEEGVALVSRLLAGEEVTTSGRRYALDRVRLASVSVPIWASGMWPRRRPIHGAKHAQDFFPITKSLAPEARAADDPRGSDSASRLGVTRPRPDDMRSFLARAVEDGGPADADLVLWTPEGPHGVDLDAYRAAGVTWWLQGEEQVRVDELQGRIEAGPPNQPGT